MKKSLLLTLTIFIAFIYAACNNKQCRQTNEALTNIVSDSAVLYYTDYQFNLDTIKVGKTESFDFNYTNKGKSPLLISNVFTSCGCVSITWDKRPLLTEQSNSIKFDVTIQGPGYFQKAIVVKNNSMNEPVLTIRVSGFAKE